MNPADPSEPKNVTAAEASARLGVPVHTVRDWVDAGKLLPLGRVGGRGAAKLYSLRTLRGLADEYHRRKREKAARKGTKK